MPLRTYNGRLLRIGNDLASNEDCCCAPCDDATLGCCCFGSFSSTTQELSEFGVTQCDCQLMGGTWRESCDDCTSSDGYGSNDDGTAPSGKCNICKTITIVYNSFDHRPLEYDNEALCDQSCTGSPTDCVSDPGNTNCADSFPGFPGSLTGSLSCYCDDCGAGSECYAFCHVDTSLTVTVSFSVQSGACASFTQTSSSSSLALECGCDDATYNDSSITIRTRVAQINTGQSYTATGTSTTKNKLTGQCNGLYETSTPVSTTLTC